MIYQAKSWSFILVVYSGGDFAMDSDLKRQIVTKGSSEADHSTL